jgi:hypothetical protein
VAAETILPALRTYLLSRLGLPAESPRVLLAQRGPQAHVFPRPPCLVLNLVDQGQATGTPSRLLLDGHYFTLQGRRGTVEITAFGVEAQGWLAALGPELELHSFEGFDVISAGRLLDVSALTATGYEPTTFAEFEVAYLQVHDVQHPATLAVLVNGPDTP